MTIMTTIDTLKQLARIDDMLALREEALRADDPESKIVVKLMDQAVYRARQALRNANQNLNQVAPVAA